MPYSTPTEVHLLTCRPVNINIMEDAVPGVQTSTVCTQVHWWSLNTMFWNVDNTQTALNYWLREVGMVYQGMHCALYALFCCSLILYRKQIARLARSFFLPSTTGLTLLVNFQLPLQLQLASCSAILLELVICTVGSCLHQKVPLTEPATAQEPEVKHASPIKLT